MLLSLERHIVEHVEEDLFWCTLYECRGDVYGTSSLRKLHALWDVDVGRQTIIFEPECF